MNKRKPMALIVSGSVALALSVVVLVVLVLSAGRYAAVQSNLKRTMDRIAQLRTGDPRHGNRFPAQDNVEMTRTNLARMDAAFQTLLNLYSKNQITAENVEPARFPLLLDKRVRALNECAGLNSVTIADQFAYGFDRYATVLPVREDIERLTRQMAAVDLACRALFDERIRELTKVERQVFEASAAVAETVPANARRPGRRGPAAAQMLGLPPEEYKDPSGLYRRERIILTFQVRESGVWDVINAMSRLSPFCVISNLEILDRQEPAAAGNELTGPEGVITGASGRTRILPRAQRIVAGKAPVVEVHMSVDFFQFEPSESDAPQQGA